MESYCLVKGNPAKTEMSLSGRNAVVTQKGNALKPLEFGIGGSTTDIPTSFPGSLFFPSPGAGDLEAERRESLGTSFRIPNSTKCCAIINVFSYS